MADDTGSTRDEDVASLLRKIKSGEVPSSQTPADLSGALLAGEDLSGMDFSGKNLSGANLTGANLSGAKFFRANLSSAVLLKADLSKADFTGAVLAEVDLEDAVAVQAGFGMAQMQGAHLFGANFEGASLTKANMCGADLRCACLREARIREANLSGCDFTEVDLARADLALSDVTGAVFVNANMSNVNMRLLKGYQKADWIGVDIRDINFAGAYMIRRFIVDQNYIKEFRLAGRLSAVIYYVWWVTSDCGRSLTLWCFWISAQMIFFAWLYTLVGIDFGDHPTALSPFYYSVVTFTTLGYGDIVPSSMAGQVIAMVEVVMGYVMLGGLLAIFTNKIARRAD